MATMKEIAKVCGVSTATVSKALNGYSDIGEDTARLVRETAEKLGYYPNSVARALKTNRTHNLGILFMDQMGSGLGHEYFSSLLESFKVQAEQLGYDITFISRNLGGSRMSYLEHCRYRHCDGVVIASVDFHDPEVQELVRKEIPVVTIDHVFNSCTAILSDNVDSVRQLVHHVHGFGHRRIAYIHGEDTAVTQKRLAGFHMGCQEVGINIPDGYIKPARFHDPKSSALATRELLTLVERPTCIMYPDDFSFIGGMNEIERSGLKIPQDISVVGHDGILLSKVLRPKLTTMQQDSFEIGRVAASKLIRAIEEPRTSFPQQIVVPGKLVIGESVARVPVSQIPVHA